MARERSTRGGGVQPLSRASFRGLAGFHGARPDYVATNQGAEGSSRPHFQFGDRVSSRS